MKNILIILLIVAGVYYFLKQSSQCETQEDLQRKTMEMMDKFRQLTVSGDMNKIVRLTKKMQNIQFEQKIDIPSTCKAMDALMEEL